MRADAARRIPDALRGAPHVRRPVAWSGDDFRWGPLLARFGGCTLQCVHVFSTERAADRLLARGLAYPGFAQSGRPVTPKDPTQGQKQAGEGGADVLLGTQEVLLTITVHDAKGHAARGLTSDDFIVAEDRVRQRIVSCTVASQPVNVVLLLDASGSVFNELASIREAADSFVRALGPEDRVAVVQFAQKVELLQDWTTDREASEHAIDWRYKPAIRRRSGTPCTSQGINCLRTSKGRERW